MAPTHVLFGGVPIYADKIISVSAVESNYHELFCYLKPHASGTNIYLPLSKWSIQPNLKVWFNVCNLGEMFWFYPIPPALHEFLDNIKVEYRNTLLMPTLCRTLVDDVFEETKRLGIPNTYQYYHENAVMERSQFIQEWQMALRAIPREQTDA